ncbi:SDR family oxidoreductase [Mesorhizobium sp. M0184]|uniref:SDR family NAD(P)-dependent oxidoreductase n=1 Tax=Mesorhizobium sp. M0184 TaxID=2956906 RepID=UPI00333DCBE9
MSGRLNGKTVLVTGGASGIGAASVRKIECEGGTVIVGDKVIGDNCSSAVHLDVTDPESISEAIDRIVSQHGRLDCLVHCAGISEVAPFLDTSLGTFDTVLNVNLRGTFMICQAAAKTMVQFGGGAIVNVGSVSGMIGNQKRAAYGTSKAAVSHLSKIMAAELAPQGIRVNVICPGPISTPMAVTYSESAVAEWHDRVPMGRFGSPEEVGSVIAFLCSEEASYITGQEIAVDGGFIIAGVEDAAVR